ncbi:hypothetical protein [Amycolatopsis nigrescens]|uniref:hypothetical protein n=1 Tax=Amycolatopsis nigrescens TaxID=381445 RepID=UPI00039BD6E9|nr:hypothetical protein [Amycolatopsis nigrescens]
MNGGAHSTDHLSAQRGRHRLQTGMSTWTPQVPPRPEHHRHRLDEDLLDPPVTGSLPVSQLLDQHTRDTRADGERNGADLGSRSGYLSSSGRLPVPRAPHAALRPLAPEQARPEQEPPGAGRDEATVRTAPVGADPKKPLRRTKVSLKPPPPRRDDDDDVRIYVAPPVDGLGTFDLGSVPASVTPPRSWRKAAWFATASSGGVVVALLCAGSLLVGKPENTNQQAVSWPGLQGVQPTLEGESLADSNSVTPGLSDNTSHPGGDSSSAEGLTGPRAGTSRASSTARPSSPSDQPTSSTGSEVVVPPAPPTTEKPVKPAPTAAPYDEEDPRYLQYPVNQPSTLAAQSQKFLDTVTEDPAAAHSMTTGPLQEQGANGLAGKYSGVAYYEVKHVDVRQYTDEGVTVCTVKAVHDDGSTTTERHTLTFGQNAKIRDDGK